MKNRTMTFQGIQKQDFIESINIVLFRDSGSSRFVPLDNFKGCCPTFYPLTPGVCRSQSDSERCFFRGGEK